MAETTIDYQHTQKLVQVKALSKWFPVKRGIIEGIQRKPKQYVKAVDNVTLDIYRGESRYVRKSRKRDKRRQKCGRITVRCER